MIIKKNNNDNNNNNNNNNNKRKPCEALRKSSGDQSSCAGFTFVSKFWEGRATFLDQLQGEVRHNRIIFDTYLKITLMIKAGRIVIWKLLVLGLCGWFGYVIFHGSNSETEF